MIQMNLQDRNRLMDKENKFMVTQGERASCYIFTQLLEKP